MKIIEHYLNQEEPQDCDSCDLEFNAQHIILLELFEGFKIRFCLCEKCFSELDLRIKQETCKECQSMRENMVSDWCNKHKPKRIDTSYKAIKKLSSHNMGGTHGN